MERIPDAVDDGDDTAASQDKSSETLEASETTPLLSKVDPSDDVILGQCNTVTGKAYADIVEVLSARGDPLALLLDGVVTLCPIIGPLLVIVHLNLTSVSWIMDCNHSYTSVRAACAITQPFVRSFPLMGVVSSYIIVAWRMVHVRAYYVLLQHRIVVDFERNGPKLGSFFLKTLAFMFTLVLAHFTLTIQFGYAADGKPYLNQPASDFMRLAFQNPVHAFNSNPNLLPYLMLIGLKFVGPAVLTLIFMLGFNSLESQLVPVNEYLQQNPYLAHSLLGESMFIPEHVVIDVLRKGVLRKGFDAGPCAQGELCRELGAHASGYEGVAVISASEGRTSRRMEQVDDDARANLFYDTVTLNWWPMQLLIDPKLTDADSISFKHVVGWYYVSSFIGTVLMMWAGLRTLYWWIDIEALSYGVDLPPQLGYVFLYSHGESISLPPETDANGRVDHMLNNIILLVWYISLYAVLFAIFAARVARHMWKHGLNVFEPDVEESPPFGGSEDAA